MKQLKGTLVLLMVVFGAKSMAGPYGMAGCGVGALVFGDQPGKVQIASGILNNLISPQTSAITSGTSNCYEETSSVAAIKFIEANKEALQKEISQGQGETLSGLLTMWGCNNTSAVGGVLHNNYQQIYKSNNPNSSELGQSLKTVIRNDQVAAQNCPAVI